VQLDGRLSAAKVGDTLVNLYQFTGTHVFAVFLVAMPPTRRCHTAWTPTTC
jgi:hypothetical protein